MSRVLNNNANISPKTAERVWEAAKKLGYEPNLLARSLRKQQTNIILVLVPNITNPYYTHIFSGISDKARKLGYSSFICNTDGDVEREKEFLDMLGRRRADGAILLATELEAGWLGEYNEKYPIVQCSEYDPDVAIPRVMVDNYKAARDVVKYLRDLGHTKIGTISSKNNYISTQLRLQGYRDELLASGLEPRDDYVFFASVDYSFDSGLEGTKALLSQRERPTALFCISDVLAQGALAAASELGLSVPGDVTVIGFDDVETTRQHPHITTLAQPCAEIGKRATELLHDLMNNGEHASEAEKLDYILPHHLIVRESSGRPL